jgi:hypothetical protein
METKKHYIRGKKRKSNQIDRAIDEESDNDTVVLRILLYYILTKACVWVCVSSV